MLKVCTETTFSTLDSLLLFLLLPSFLCHFNHFIFIFPYISHTFLVFLIFFLNFFSYFSYFPKRTNSSLFPLKLYIFLLVQFEPNLRNSERMDSLFTLFLMLFCYFYKVVPPTPFLNNFVGKKWSLLRFFAAFSIAWIFFYFNSLRGRVSDQSRTVCRVVSFLRTFFLDF